VTSSAPLSLRGNPRQLLWSGPTAQDGVPLPGLERAPFFRRISNPLEDWQPHAYPYQTLPPLESHISPPMAVINGGPKCIGVDLDAIARECHQKTESQQALRRQLELLREIWALFLNVQNTATPTSLAFFSFCIVQPPPFS